MRRFLAILIIIIGLAAVAVWASAYIVRQNEQVLVLRFGEPRDIVGVGLNWRVPLVDSVYYFDKRILDLDMPQKEVTASDQKRIIVDAFARYRIVDPLLFYQRVTNVENVNSRLAPIMESSLRRVLGGATLQDLVRDKREELMGRIAEQVNQEGKEFGLEVVDVRIKRADLPPQNSKSVFGRMRSEREREANEFRAEGTAKANRITAEADRDVTVIKAEAQRKAEQLRGEGDAERNRIFADAYQRDPDFFGFYRSMQAYEHGLNSGDTRIVISPDSEFFRYFGNPAGTDPPGSVSVAKPGQ